MAHLPCPSCSAPVLEPPLDLRCAKRECSRCGDPLVYYTTGARAGVWLLDGDEHARRHDRDGYADAA